MTGAPSSRTSITARYRCSTTPSSTSTRLPSPRSAVDRSETDQARKTGNQVGVSPTYRNYCRPATGTASANCRPGTGTKVSSIYRTRTGHCGPFCPSKCPSGHAKALLPKTGKGPLTCGAPLRNRTVDLLLTMGIQQVHGCPTLTLSILLAGITVHSGAYGSCWLSGSCPPVCPPRTVDWHHGQPASTR
jgi:hypothetical protein